MLILLTVTLKVIHIDSVVKCFLSNPFSSKSMYVDNFSLISEKTLFFRKKNTLFPFQKRKLSTVILTNKTNRQIRFFSAFLVYYFYHKSAREAVINGWKL